MVVMKRLRRFLDLYIAHRERFEREIKDEYPIVYFIRARVTRLLKLFRRCLQVTEM